MFAFSFIWITLGWLEYVSKITSKFWKVSPYCGFHSGMFSVFVILTKYLLKIFATLCLSDIERFFLFFFSINVILWLYCEPFSVKKDVQRFLFTMLLLVKIQLLRKFFFAFLYNFRIRFRCFLYAFRSSTFPLLFTLFLSLDLVMIFFLIRYVRWGLLFPWTMRF